MLDSVLSSMLLGWEHRILQEQVLPRAVKPQQQQGWRPEVLISPRITQGCCPQAHKGGGGLTSQMKPEAETPPRETPPRETPVKHAGKSRSQLTSSYNHATARNTAKKAHFLPMTNSPPLLPLTGRQTWVVRDITIVRTLSGYWIGAVILRGFSTMDS